MKAPTVATLYPRHGDFAATNGSAPTCSVTPDLDCGALSRGGRPSGPGYGAYTWSATREVSRSSPRPPPCAAFCAVAPGGCATSAQLDACYRGRSRRRDGGAGALDAHVELREV